MKDRKKIDREYQRVRAKQFIKTVIALFFVASAWITLAYFAYEIPSRAEREYHILIRDYEWRRARLETPYRALEEGLGEGCLNC